MKKEKDKHCRSLYWGKYIDEKPEGMGVLLKDKLFYIGTFIHGMKTGSFYIVSAVGEGDLIQKDYDNDTLVEEEKEVEEVEEPSKNEFTIPFEKLKKPFLHPIHFVP